MIRLFHVSETAGLARFDPRPDRNGEPAVWAISADRLHNYLLPRDCPRVTFYALPDTTPEDRETLLGTAANVVAIETCWEVRARNTALSVYEFDGSAFCPKDAVAGYYTSGTSQVPLNESRLDSALAALEATGAELRVVPELWRLREAVADSTLGFSIIRFRNAGPPPAGFVSRYPMPSGPDPAGA